LTTEYAKDVEGVKNTKKSIMDKVEGTFHEGIGKIKDVAEKAITKTIILIFVLVMMLGGDGGYFWRRRR
jgi:hypothetical protein